MSRCNRNADFESDATSGPVFVEAKSNSLVDILSRSPMG